MQQTLHAGIDEAGRGPVLGPLVIGLVVLTSTQQQKLAELGVTDSKKLSAKKREELFTQIHSHSTHAQVQIVPATQIDTYLTSGTNLNMVEAIETAKLCTTIPLTILSQTKLMIDLPSKNKTQYLQSIATQWSNTKQLGAIDAEFKADLNHIAVGAASILAKVTRDNIIREIEAQIGIPIGSGYPSDPVTKAFIAAHAKDYPHICRNTWESIKRLQQTDVQHTLDTFSQKK